MDRLMALYGIFLYLLGLYGLFTVDTIAPAFWILLGMALVFTSRDRLIYQ